MAIAISQLGDRPPSNNEALVEMYKQAALELKERARQRLVRDARKLTKESLRARMLEREVADILERLDADTAQWIADNIPRAYLRGARKAQLGLAEIGIEGAIDLTPLVHEAAVQVLVNGAQDSFAVASDQLAKGYRQVVKRTQLALAKDQAMQETIARELITGKTQLATKRELVEQLLAEYGDKPFRVGGRTFEAGEYAEIVSRTMEAEASTAGTVNAMVDAGEDLVMVSAHGADDGCGYYEGKVFSISGTSDKYPALDSTPNGGPPFHPNCRHAVLPYVEELASGAERRNADGVPEDALGKPYRDVEKMRRAERTGYQGPPEAPGGETEGKAGHVAALGLPDFVEATTVEEAQRYAKEIGVRLSEPSGGDPWASVGRAIGKEKDKIAHANLINKTATEFQRDFPSVRGRMPRQIIRNVSRGKAFPPAMVGSSPGYNGMVIRSAKSTATTNWENIREWEAKNGRKWGQIRPDTADYDGFRHEWSHTQTTQDIVYRWSRANNMDDDFWKQVVSEYAGSDGAFEQIAESFTMYTSKDYVKGSLPTWAETILQDILEGNI